MSESRFEKYVRETVMDGVREKRNALVAEVRSAEADLESKMGELIGIINTYLDKAGTELEKRLSKFGWHIDEAHKGRLLKDAMNRSTWKSNLEDRIDSLKRTYVPSLGRYDYAEKHPAREAEAKLIEFDERIDKAIRRLVVMKVDLKMKTDEFDRALNEKVKEILA
jgi:hypothetical protein